MNIARGERYSLLDLLDGIARATGGAANPEFAPPRPGDVRDSLADVTRAKTLLGFAARTGFDEGLRRTVDHFRGLR